MVNPGLTAVAALTILKFFGIIFIENEERKRTLMKIYVLITDDGAVSGVFSNTDKMIAELTTSLSATAIKNVEI